MLRRCCCATAVPMAPPDAPMPAVGLPLKEFLPYGREAQSMAFLSTPGIERLYSGVTISTPSAASIWPLMRVTAAGGLGSRSWLNSGRSSIFT